MQYVSFGAFLVSSLHLPSMFICWSWSSMALLAINVNVFYALLKVYTVETMLITLITQHFTARSPTSDDIQKKMGYYCGLIYIWLWNIGALKLPMIFYCHACFHRIGPLGRFDLVVAMSVCMCVCLSPSHAIF